MAKVSSIFILFSLFLLFTGGLERVTCREAKDICTKGFGLCTKDCDINCCKNKCAGEILGGQGSCDSIANVVLCNCYYHC
ncbi:PREDICTED: defensin-like protein 183 [Tarenaya hassleriana]|uniref:defensin-like protein 183 n=1 Tax=Tarenaya hassleriana TaxID=28532 RepID=UPI00053C3CAD|nr:PREDICTED: defensin-like protein 183 [Tarenaya hassleriana]